MGARGELFTNEVYLDNRSYFFNVKENRAGDVFLQIVESKNKEGASEDRHQIAIFADDMQKFLSGLETSLAYIEKDRKTRSKVKAERRAEKAERAKKIYKLNNERTISPSQVKKTGKIHIVSKRKPTEEN